MPTSDEVLADLIAEYKNYWTARENLLRRLQQLGIGAGPQNYARDALDTILRVDAANRTWLGLRLTLDAVSRTDSAQQVVTKLRQATETLQRADVASHTKVLFRSAVDAIHRIDADILVSATGTHASTIPANVDDTGATNCTVNLMAYLNNLAPGTHPYFKPTGIYRVDTALKLGGRANIDFDGQGATVKCVGTGFNENYSAFYFQTFPGTNSGNKVHGFNIIGSDPTPGTFTSGNEGQMGVLLDGGTGFEVYGNTFRGMFGDAVEVNSNCAASRIHDNTVLSCGRNAVSVIYGHNIEVDHNDVYTCGYMPWDVEPNVQPVGQPATPSNFINIHHNTSRSWTNAYFALDGSSTGYDFHDITIADNISIGKSLFTVVVGPARKRAISFVRNTSDTNDTRSPGLLQFNHVDTLIVQNNNQPHGGTLVFASADCTDTHLTPNP